MSWNHTIARSRSSKRGFTLIELMAVLAILGVLAAIAIGAYTKNTRTARRAEVIGDLSNIALKEDAFFSVRGHYASTTNSENLTYPVNPNQLQNATGAIQWSATDPAYTQDAAGGQYFQQGGNEHGFDALNFMPENARSYCAYGVISGDGTLGEFGDEPPGDPLGQDVFPGNAELTRFYARDWFYAFAKCDFDHDGDLWEFTRPHFTSTVSMGDGTKIGE